MRDARAVTPDSAGSTAVDESGRDAREPGGDPSRPGTPQIPRVLLGGLLGRALAANHAGRLSHFISDETSPAIAIFDPEQVSRNHEGDWYGEHAGKWLYAAAKSAQRGGDGKLLVSIRRVADHLVGLQDDDGYLGTYAPERRFMRKQAPAPRSWDGAPSKRTWDIWNHSCLVLGLLEVHKHFPDQRYLSAASRIGDLCWRTLNSGAINITELGLHHGLSATVLLDAAVELHVATGERKYLDLATLILRQADEHPELELLRQALAGTDAAEIATGKAYQICWNLVGLAKLHKATGDAQYLTAVENVWNSIRRHHLTLGSGPWGGVGLRSREVFNHPSIFSPNGYVETCSILSWIQLNRELLSITGDARYAEEIECAAYNDLLGAQAPNGEDWCYYSFPNGRRVYTTYWRCCKSSGAMALEELPGVAYRQHAENSLAINLYGPGEATLPTASAGMVTLEQVTDYPFEGSIQIIVKPERPATFSILLRIPSWASGTVLKVNGVACNCDAAPGSYAVLERDWHYDDIIALQLPMPPVVHRRTSRSIQESKDPYGESIQQEVMRYDYLAITRGPLVYATGLIDGYKMQETIRLADGDIGEQLEVIDAPPGGEGPAIRLNLNDRAPLVFHPYYEAGGREDGTWRLTWLQVTT